jgi:hypothetical protein
MAGGVKVLERPGTEGSYVRAASKGLGVTLKHMLRPWAAASVRRSVP